MRFNHQDDDEDDEDVSLYSSLLSLLEVDVEVSSFESLVDDSDF